MKIFDDVLSLISAASEKFVSAAIKGWGEQVFPWMSFLALWILTALTSILSIFDILRRWSAVGDGEEQLGFFSALFSYPVGGRLLVALLFLAAVIFLARKSRSWLLGISSVYFIARLLDLDSFVLDLLEAQDPFAQIADANQSPVFSLTFTAVTGITALALVLLLAYTFPKTRAFTAFRTGLREGFSRLRISEIILWVVLLTQAVLFLVAWLYLWLVADAFAVMLTYPVIGRFIIVVLFAILLIFSVRQRGFLLTLAISSYVVQLLGVDGMLVEAFGQQDRIFGGRFGDPNLTVIGELLVLANVLLPILLLWIAVISIASVVRARARRRINTWIDSRRESIYGVEDHGSEAPTRVSVLAVFSLVTAIVFPLLGLVLAYAARNDFVAARPKKAGVDLAVAATIIGWFGLGIQLLLVIVAFVGSVFNGPGPLDLFFGLFQALFGLSALTGGADLFGSLFEIFDS